MTQFLSWFWKSFSLKLLIIIISSAFFSPQVFGGTPVPDQTQLPLVSIDIDEQLSVSAADIVGTQITTMKNFTERALRHPLFEKYLPKISSAHIDIRIIADMEGGLFDDGVSPLSCGRSTEIRRLGINIGKSVVIDGSWPNVLAHEIFHFVHYLINPDEPAWLREGLALWFEYEVTRRAPGNYALSALQIVQTPLMGEYVPCEINGAQYGHDFLFFDFLYRNCGGNVVVEKILEPSHLKGKEKLQSIFSALPRGLPLFCSNFTQVATTFEVARVHNKIVFAPPPSFLAEQVRGEVFRLWPVNSLLKPKSPAVPSYESLGIYEPMVLEEGVRVQVTQPDFAVFWLEQDSPYSIIKSHTPPRAGRFRQLIIRNP